MEYRTIAAPVSASFVEKKSEFIAQLFPVRTQEDAVAVSYTHLTLPTILLV